MHPRVGSELLAHGVHVVEQLQHAVERVYPEVGLRRSVCRLTAELDHHAIRGERVPARERSSGSRVDHHRDVDVVEAAGANERHLAAAALLRGCTDRRELSRQLIHHRAHAHGRGDADHRDEVVAARVSDLSEGVVFLEDRDRRSGTSAFRVAPIRGLDVLVAALDRESRALEELGDADGGLSLFIRELGLRVDRAREREERVATLVDRLDRALGKRLRVAQCD